MCRSNTLSDALRRELRGTLRARERACMVHATRSPVARRMVLRAVPMPRQLRRDRANRQSYIGVDTHGACRKPRSAPMLSSSGTVRHRSSADASVIEGCRRRAGTTGRRRGAGEAHSRRCNAARALVTFDDGVPNIGHRRLAGARRSRGTDKSLRPGVRIGSRSYPCADLRTRRTVAALWRSWARIYAGKSSVLPQRDDSIWPIAARRQPWAMPLVDRRTVLCYDVLVRHPRSRGCQRPSQTSSRSPCPPPATPAALPRAGADRYHPSAGGERECSPSTAIRMWRWYAAAEVRGAFDRRPAAAAAIQRNRTEFFHLNLRSQCVQSFFDISPHVQ